MQQRQQAAPERLVMTVAEAASVLGVHHLTIRRAVERGELHAVRLGRRVIIPRASLESFLDGRGRNGK